MTSPFSSPLLKSAALLSAGTVSLLLACTATPAAKTEKLCTPGDYVFCRCRDRQEASKLCKEDGMSFGPCEPCDGLDTPELPFDPGDSGKPDVEDGGRKEAGLEGPKSCGNGVIESGEDCDDKNGSDTDGCDSNCRLSGLAPAATNACPGLEVHVWGGTHTPSLAGTTVGSGNRSVAATCGSSEGSTPTIGGASADRVFKVVAHKTGTLEVAVTETDYNAFVYVAEACPSDNVEWATCSNEVDGVGNETVSLPVTSGMSYYVFVDGALPSNLDGTKLQGNYRVTFSIP